MDEIRKKLIKLAPRQSSWRKDIAERESTRTCGVPRILCDVLHSTSVVMYAWLYIFFKT